MTISDAIAADLPAIVAIYNASIPGTRGDGRYQTGNRPQAGVILNRRSDETEALPVS